MLPINPLNIVKGTSPASKPLVTPVSQNPAAKLELGSRFQGYVQAQISAGLFKVLVAGQSIQMRLPSAIRSGEIIHLQLIADSPQLKFSLAASNSPISTQEKIGAASRFLSDLAQLPREKPNLNPLAGNAIWQPDNTPDSTQLAAALRNALGNSGLFYESHQAQWVRGARSKAQLLVEPQNQLKDLRVSAQESALAARLDTLNRAESPTAIRQTAQINTAQTDSAAPSPAPEKLAIARELLPLVQQQLHTLETHQLTWVGQVWPNQVMQWEIQGQPEHAPRQPDERQWSTEMELALPTLGDVHAKLIFTANGLKLTLRASDEKTVARFKHDLALLQNALSNVNINLNNVVLEKS